MTKEMSFGKKQTWLMLILFTAIVALSFPHLAWGYEDQIQENLAFNEGCLRCHGAQGLKKMVNGETVSLYVEEANYLSSMHGTMKCTICHTDIVDYPHVGALSGKDLREAVNNRCIQCHDDVAEVYKDSVHGKAMKRGSETALCRDCHGKHDIKKTHDPESMVFKKNLPETCTHCHNDHVKHSYEESYHGKAVILGSSKSASCVDCHGSHDMLGQSDPNSPVHVDNIPETCAKCHRTAEENFAKGKEHWTLERGGPGEPMYWTLKFFVWLTVCTIAFLIIHMELELYRKYKDADKDTPGH